MRRESFGGNSKGKEICGRKLREQILETRAKGKGERKVRQDSTGENCGRKHGSDVQEQSFIKNGGIKCERNFRKESAGVNRLVTAEVGETAMEKYEIMCRKKKREKSS
ncbi:hypothetical protein HHI36_007847 [Cryptolaemus montrouzieri]|uniref:Uncharacterized protein n=1 Tax=Cryptolaemus montrouzieri TaxID=559131 RepID=A0ABD2MRA4_9CUCU